MVKLMETITKETPKEDQQYLKKWGEKLSPSTQRAKWISSSHEHADHNGQTLATRNHEVIRQWAEARRAKPASVPGSEHNGHLGVLRFDFPGGSTGKLQEVSWEAWFKAFDDRHLVMIYQEKLKNGNQSNFFRFDNPDREDA